MGVMRSRGRRFLALLFLLAGGATGPLGEARADEACAAPAAPIVTIETAPPAMTQDETLSMGELDRLQGVHSMANTVRHAVFGLTQSSRDAVIDVTTGVAPTAHGRYCGWIARIRVVLTPRIRVHIAREATPNPCFRDYVLAHELRHVAVERSAVPAEALYVQGRLQDAAAAIPAREFPAGASQGAWAREAMAQLGIELRRIIEEVVPQRQSRHRQEVDEPDQGSGSSVCGGFGAGLVEAYRQQVASAASVY
jgi:hypothetical protein